MISRYLVFMLLYAWVLITHWELWYDNNLCCMFDYYIWDLDMIILIASFTYLAWFLILLYAYPYCLIFSLCVDMDDLYMFCMTNYWMNTFLLHGHMLLVHMGHMYPLIFNSLVLVISYSFAFTFTICEALFMLAFRMS